MKTTHKLALGLAALLLAGSTYGQTTPTTSTVYPTSSPSIQDNPGKLGHTFADFNYSWVDFQEANGDPEAFVAGVSGNTPISRGLDLGLGYSYFRENGHRNPFTGSDFDVRSHSLSSALTFYRPMAGFKPFVSGGLGYRWSKGDIQSFRVEDDDWAWGASAGAEIPLGTFALTPRAAYGDTFDGGYNGTWHFGTELHKWFSEKAGAYLDATFHNPRTAAIPEYWTYTAGFRLRF
jgi:hypothetical protein